MTKIRLFAILLAMVILLTGTSTAYAKSANTTAKVDNPYSYSVVYEVPETKPIRNPDNRWKDSGRYEVWEGVPVWIRDLGYCIRKHESINVGHYKAHNGRSSAAGAYQFLDGTWQGNAKWTKHNGKFIAKKYKAANHAPPWIQDLVFIHSIKHGGVLNWSGTNCGYGT